MASVHPTAIVDATAELADDVDDRAVLDRRPRRAHRRGHASSVRMSVIGARTTLGERNRIFQFASIGEIAQDRKYGGEPTTTTIGDDNVFREYVSVHAGTAQDRGDTTIGNGNLFLAYTHVAHDCVVGNHTTFSNNAQIAGHVHIGDWVVLGAFAGVHQFCRVGAHAMLAAFAVVLQDVPPFVTVAGLSGAAARHQQRRPAPARLRRRGHPRGPARVQDALPRRTRRSTTRGRSSPTAAESRRWSAAGRVSRAPRAAASSGRSTASARCGERCAMRGAGHRSASSRAKRRAMRSPRR